MAKPHAYTYLDASFVAQAQGIFDRAERRVEGDPVLQRRVRHARLSLDRATLVLWPDLRREIAGKAARNGRGVKLETVVDRYRRTWSEQIDLRLDRPYREHALREVEREIAFRLAEAGR